jgi:DNA-binding LacI/PurR family transcriptional regulator
MDLIPKFIHRSWDSLRVDLENELPLSVQIADQITWLIASGQVSAGTKLPTIRNLANHLGINLHTVRAAYMKLEAQALVTTRRGIGSIALEFKPEKVEGRDNGLQTHVVGLLIPDLSGPFYSALLEGVQKVATAHRLFVIVSSTGENVQTAMEQLRMLVAKRVDGILLASDYLLEDGTLAELEPDPDEFGIPIINIDRPDINEFSVCFDAEEMGYQATTHLLDHGYERVALITPPRAYPTMRNCYAGYLRALADAGIELNKADIRETSDFSLVSGSLAALQILDQVQPPKSIFVAEDLLAIGAISAIRERGLRIPEDVALVGANNFEISRFIDPGLTTVYSSAKEIGAEAMQFMISVLNNEDIQRRKIVLPTSLVIRGSCGCQREKWDSAFGSSQAP